MEKIGLKPCPFCGGKATLDQTKVYEMSKGDLIFYSVKCDNDCLYRPTSQVGNESLSNAVKAWNRRKVQK